MCVVAVVTRPPERFRGVWIWIQTHPETNRGNILNPTELSKGKVLCSRLLFTTIVIESRMSRMADQNEKEFYIKGYKVDRDKLLNNFPTRPDDPENVRMMWLWENFPTEFLYLGKWKRTRRRAQFSHCLG
jgi:hypothetical protein